MKYCTSCGQPIDDDSLFCTSCGARVEQDAAQETDNYAADSEEEDLWEEPREDRPKKPAKARKAARKNLLRLGIAISAVVVVAAVIVTLILTNAIGTLLPHSKAKLMLAERNLLKEAAAYAETGVSDAEGLDMGYELSAKMSVPKDSWGGMGEVAEIVNRFKVSGGVKTSKDNLKFRSQVSYKENELGDVMLFLDKKDVGVYTSLIDDQYYTCSIKDLMSIITNEEMDDLPDSSKLQDMDLAKKDLEKAMTAVFKDLFNANMKITKGKTVDLFDEEETVKGVAIYQISPSEKDWKAMMQDAFNAALYKGSYMYNALQYATEVGYLDDDADDLMDELKEMIPDIAEKLADQELKIEVVMKGNTIIRQRLYNEEGQVGYDALTSGKQSRFFVFFGDEDELMPLFDFQSTKNGSKLEFESTVYSRREKFIRMSGSDINLSKRSTLDIPVGEYTVSVYTYRLNMTVTPEGKGMNHEVRFKFTESSRSNPFDSLTVTLYTQKGTKIDKPKGLETVEITERKDLEKVAEKLSKKLSSIAEKIVD